MDISKPEVRWRFLTLGHKALEQSSDRKQRAATGSWYGACPGYEGIDMVSTPGRRRHH